MRKLLMTTAAALIASGGVSAPAMAQAAQPAQPQQQAAKPAKDPNEVICEKEEEIGTRLGSQKVCKTRAEWAEERRANRNDLDKMQTNRDLNH